MKLVQNAEKVWVPMMAGQEYDKNILNEFYAELSKDILQQKKRIGGNWAIALVVFKKELRDTIRFKNKYPTISKVQLCIISRDILGPNLTFVHLTMDTEERKERLAQRHEGNENFIETLEVQGVPEKMQQ